MYMGSLAAELKYFDFFMRARGNMKPLSIGLLLSCMTLMTLSLIVGSRA
jgi:hypothetical protein